MVSLEQYNKNDKVDQTVKRVVDDPELRAQGQVVKLAASHCV
ncbi:MAG TPA: hypothetical protein VIG24_13065 [Acidimicrobiia bacterium]